MKLFVVGPALMTCALQSPSPPLFPTLLFVDARRRDKASADAVSGSADSGYANFNAPTGAADTEDYTYVECWNSWWFFRTLFQSFGENL